MNEYLYDLWSFGKGFTLAAGLVCFIFTVFEFLVWTSIVFNKNSVWKDPEKDNSNWHFFQFGRWLLRTIIFFCLFYIYPPKEIIQWLQ